MARIQLEADKNAMTGGPAPVGEYLLRVTEVESGTTKEKGYAKSNLKVEIEGGPYGGKWIYHNLTYIPKGEKGHGFTVHALKALGMPHDGAVDFDDQDLIGRTFRADVGIEPYTAKDGTEKIKNVISRFLVAGEPSQAEADAAKPVRAAAPKAQRSEDLESVPF